MGADQVVVFIHGLGDGPDSWTHQVTGLPAGFKGLAVGVPGLSAAGVPGLSTAGAPGLSAAGTSGTKFNLADASSGIVDELDRLGIDTFHLCGLSLGAMIALRIAIDRPERVQSLVLAAGQVKPPRVLMAAQNAITRILPTKFVAPAGTSKAQLLDAVRAIADTDFSGDLASVTAPTLVLCGSKDRANLPAARTLAAGIPDATLHIIEGAGHQSNTQKPERFSAALNNFLCR